jgi:hypothetical protein
VDLSEEALKRLHEVTQRLITVGDVWWLPRRHVGFFPSDKDRFCLVAGIETPTGGTPLYQSGAYGARSNVYTRMPQAPALRYVSSTGDEALVRFDGFTGRVLIDRKLAVVTTSKVEDQALRQSLALRQNGLTGVWEVPTAVQAARATALLDKLRIDNITVRVVPF